jgi:ankyrin repeat protein
MAQPVAKRQKLEEDGNIFPQLSGARYDNTTAQGNSRNVYGNVINTYHVGPQQVPAAPERTPDATSHISDDLQSIMKNLEFEQMDDRLATIATAHSKTCEWLFQRGEYRAWRDSAALSTNCGFLWLKGKPGAGKSTIMKRAQHYGEQEHGGLVISFFFNARGVELQRSTQGMYRSLIHQLLKKRMEQLSALPIHEGHFLHFKLLESLVERSPQRRIPASQNWPTELLKDMLQDLVLAFSPAQVARCFDASVVHGCAETAETYRDSVLALAQTQVTCYVDALDECETDDARDMIDFLGTLRATAAQANVDFRVLLTSRHYPHITFEACQELILDGQAGHEADIADYIRNKLRIGESKLARDIQVIIRARASGVFLWVVLVIRIMNELYDRGQIRRLRQRLDAIPSGLHELFEEILQGDTQDSEERLLVFQWLLFSKRPLKLDEFYDAVTGSLELDVDVEDREQNHVSEDDMKRFLLDASKGLAEMTESRDPTVQFIHESVKDYLLDTGLVLLKPSLGTGVVVKCHIELQERCRHHLEIAQIALAPILVAADAFEMTPPADNYEEKLELKEKANATCPFLELAVEGILYHAESARSKDSTQDEIAEFIAAFPHRLWRRIYNLVSVVGERLSTEVSQLYTFVLMGACKLAEAHINAGGMSPQPPKQILPEHHRSLLGAAVANRDHAMAALLLGRGMGANWPAEDDHTCLSRAAEKGDDEMVQLLINAGANADPHANDPWGSPLLGQGLRAPGEDIILKALASDVYTARWHEDFNWILYDAKDHGYHRVEQVLISRLEAIVKEVETPGQAPPIEPYHELALLAACICDLPDLITPLAKYGASLDARHASDDTALLIATKRRFTKVVRVLLELGANPNIPDGLGSYPIHVAGSEGHDEILRMLLEAGADLSTADGAQRRPLHKATMYGSDTIIRLLIDHGADVNALDVSQKRPLAMAASLGRDSSVRLLIDHGAEINALDSHDNSALVTAARLGNLGILDMLLEAGNPVPAEQLDKAVLEALNRGQDVVVERLVQKGAKQPLLRPCRKSKVSSSSSTSEDQAIDQGDPDPSPSPSQPARSVASAAAAAAPPASILRRPRELPPL